MSTPRDDDAPPPPDDDAAWEELVAGFDAPPADPVARWPASEDLDAPASRPAPPARPLEPEPVEDLPEPVEWDEGHYVPPPPPPIPVAHPLTLWAWVALLGGLVILIGSQLISYQLSPAKSLIAVLLVVGGFVTLVARMRDSPPTDSGPDDGAVV